MQRRFSAQFTSKLELAQELPDPVMFSLVDNNGNLHDNNVDFSDEEMKTFKNILQKMEETAVIDDILLKAQRQGRISFYMTAAGETGTVIGTTAALDFKDMIFPQYRESAALYYRGFTIKQMTDNCTGNQHDGNKGRQMPIHYTAKAINCFSISSPIATQIPQAGGYGYGLRTQGKNEIAVTYLGDGAASEGDFYTALNFAQTLRSQMLFICRNNGYAISTPIREQTSGKSIMDKAKAFGIQSMMVDGNDVPAVFRATLFLRDLIVKSQQPAFLEAMTYRVGDHSTSDHSVLYRAQEEIDKWKQDNDPLKRLRAFLRSKKYIDDRFEEELIKIKDNVKKEVISCLNKSVAEKLPPIDSIFNDVYAEIPDTLKLQKEKLKKHLELYGSHYNLNRHAK